MAGWPANDLEARAAEIARAAERLLTRQSEWRHRRVETLTVLNHEQVRRAVSVDFTVPEAFREQLRVSEAGECLVPLAVLAKRPLVHFDLRNEEGHSVPLLTAEQNALIDRELLYVALNRDLARQGIGGQDRDPIGAAAGPAIAAVLAERRDPGAIDRLEREHGLARLSAFRVIVDTLSRGFVMWAVTREIDRRRVLKFASDEPFASNPGFVHDYDAPGAGEAASYHVEVAVPTDLRARSTRLADYATDAVLARGASDTDRPALYFHRGTGPPPADARLVVAYGAERARFLGPAAIVATIITLLLALPWALADLPELSGSAGPAIGLVLSTSAVFSALVLRTDEHPLLRLMLVRYRICLVVSTVGALIAGAALGFRADAGLLEAIWAAAAATSAVAAAILIGAVVRSPSTRSHSPTPER